jgi:hypothetical protein
MNSVTAVLLALVLIMVILLIVWLVLRSRASDEPGGSASSSPGAESSGTPVSVVDRMPGQGPADPRGSDGTAEAMSDATDETHPAPRAQGDDEALEDVDTTRKPAGDAGAAAAEEFVAPGLSELDERTSTSKADGDGALSGTPPRTPTEAFGSAYTSGDAAAHQAARREASALDDPDADSTPLFRSIREELLGGAAPEEPGQSADAEAVESPLADGVVAEQPEIDRTWSHERREWDEQAHAEAADAFGGSPDTAARAEAIEAQENAWSETVTERVVESGAVGVGSAGPTAEEEELLESNEDTAVDVVDPESGGVADEHPPISRISELHEVVDGGFGMGSAATIADGAQPLGHPIKANIDTKTYQDLHSPWYGETEPDVWFLDPGFAERAGFRRAE